ncbi:major tail protein [Niallia sp. 03091]|uniref:major tail protein n=1 Tax=Niallia sp. 03091 TaxID=3458059 RepID=UPI004044EBE2
MATVGFEKVIINVLDDNEKVITDKKFVLDGKNNGNGTVEANITGLAAQLQKIYASNMAIDVSGKGAGDAKIDLSIYDLPDDCLAAVTGLVKEGGIYKLGKDTKAPFCSVECLSADRKGNPIHIALLKVKFGMPDNDLKTNDNNEQVTQDKITGDAVSRASDGFVYGKAKEGDTDWSAESWESFVRPVATP